MKKRFLKLALLSLLTVALPTTFTGCKDYDDDIDNLENKTDDLQKQINTLSEALKGYQSEATTAAQAAKDAAAKAQTTADKAEKDAQEAIALAKAAEAAAKQAKADAIKAALDAIEDLKGSIATQAVVDALSTKVSAIDESLNKLSGTVDTQGNAIEQMKIQLKALEKYSDFLASLSGENGKIAQIDKAIEQINTAMSGLASQSSVEAIKRTIDSLSETVGKIEGNLITFLTGRLSSVTLVPSLYVDGIETIEFRSLSYMPQKQGGQTGLTNDGTKEIIVSTKENPAQYRLNPTSTKLSDIDADNIEFVALGATSRGVVESPIAYVKGSAVIGTAGLEKGILTINAEKTITGSLNTPPKGNIYTVALKVPIGASHLKDASTPEYVYSEYTRLVESVNTPRIAALPYGGAKHNCELNHYSDSATIWKSEVSKNQLVTVEKAYNQPVDLEKLVTGCLTNIPEEITKEELAKYGMEFRFAIPTATYNTGAQNKTNQQEFVKFQDGSKTVVISKTPAGLTDNKAAIDKEPIIRVSLVDTKNNKLVDQRYLKIRWTAVDVAPVDLGGKEATSTLGCEDVVMNVIWRDFVNDIYAKLNMSKEQFASIYLTSGSPTIEAILGYNGRSATVVVDGNVEGDAAVIKWTLTPEEIGTIVKYNTTTTPHTWSVDESKNKYGIKLTFVPNNPDYPKVIYTLKQTIEVKNVPSINGFYGNFWKTPYSLYDVYPVQYNSAAQKSLGNTVCVFHNNLMNGFTFADYGERGRFIVKGLTSCGTWDMQFCKDNEIAGYAPAFAGNEPDPATDENIGGYNLKKGEVLAAQLTWPEGHTAWCGNGEHNEAYANLYKNAEGIALLKDASSTDKSAHIGVWATINGYNVIPVYDYNIKFVKPLTLKEAKFTDHFTDGVVSGSRVDWTTSFTLRDCFGYLVAAVTPAGATAESEKYAADLYKYYEVNAPVFDTKNIKFGMKKDANGNIVVDKDATSATAMTAEELEKLTTGGSIPSLTQKNNELVFTSNMGSQVSEEFKIWVKVTVNYGWGSESTWVEIPVKPMNTSNPGAVRRK